jgi:hypothetical protein
MFRGDTMNNYCTNRLSQVLLVGGLMMGSTAHSHYPTGLPDNNSLSNSSASSARLLQPKSEMIPKDGRKPIHKMIRTGEQVRDIRIYPGKVL